MSGRWGTRKQRTDDRCQTAVLSRLPSIVASKALFASAGCFPQGLCTSLRTVARILEATWNRSVYYLHCLSAPWMARNHRQEDFAPVPTAVDSPHRRNRIHRGPARKPQVRQRLREGKMKKDRGCRPLDTSE